MTSDAMTKRREKHRPPTIHLSPGPLPARLMPEADLALVFTDASRLRHGGLAAILYDDAGSEALVFTRCVPLDGSNELELQAAVFGLEQAALSFPGRPFGLFSDNQDAMTRLSRAQTLGLEQDAALAGRFPGLDLAALLAPARLRWIKGHGSSRGNALADAHARSVASTPAGSPDRSAPAI